MEVSSEETAKQDIKLLETVEDIQSRREQVLRKYADFKKATSDRRRRLEDAKKLFQFKRDADEVELWINDKLLVASDECYKDQAHLQVKIQKHATFEAEVQAHSYMMETLVESGDVMINEEHYATDFVQQRIEELQALWALLLQKCKQKGAMLIFTQKKVTYFLNLDQLMSWLVEKLAICEVEEEFRDLDHVEIVQKRFDDFNKHLIANEVRVTEANDTCLQLESEEHPDIEEIKTRFEEVNAAWTKLKEKLEVRRQKLTDAHEIHNFYRETIDTIDWINEKDNALSTDDVGTDLASVAALQRNHENLERDLAALSDKVSATSTEADLLKEKYPASEEQITAKQVELNECWNKLQEKAEVRKKSLEDSHNLQRFVAEHSDYDAFVNEMMMLMENDDTVNDIATAEALLERHAEHKGIIDASEEGFDATVDLAETMIANDHYEKDVVAEKLADLQADRQKMIQVWDEKKKEYDQCMEHQLFNRDLEQMETIMATQENFLCSEPNADSVDGVDNLAKKQEDFENVFQAHEEKVKTINAFAEKLAAGNHYAVDDIQQKQDYLANRRVELGKLAEIRRGKIGDSAQYYQFCRECDEVRTWLNDKTKVACDESYRDPLNLQGKLQKHQAFVLELNANESRIDGISNKGKELIDADHYEKDSIQSLLEDINEMWKELNLKADEKGECLIEANQEQHFNRSVEDLEMWLSETESQLKADDLGKDLLSVKNLQQKHNLLEIDINVHQDRVSAICANADEFVEKGHFNAEAISAKKDMLLKRYHALEAPVAQRKKELEDSHSYHLFAHDVEDEESWIQEKEPLASSLHTGRDLIGAQNLLKKHQALMSEITGHEPHVNNVCQAGKDMVDVNHHLSDDIEEKIEELQLQWKELVAKCDIRKTDLEDALMTHRYLADSVEAETWMNEKASLVSNPDYGRDEDTAQAMLMKHETLMADINNFNTIIHNLREQSHECKPLLLGDISDKVVVEVINDYEEQNPREMSVQTGQILTLLNSSNRDWWKVESDDRQGFVPSSHVQKVDAIKASQDLLSNIPEVETIADRQAEIDLKYANMIEKAQDRHSKLEESIKKNAMLREAKEIESWMQESEAVVTCEEIAEDMDGIEIFQKEYDEFKKDMVVQETRIRELQLLCWQLKEEKAAECEKVQEILERVTNQWEQMHEAALKRKEALKNAVEVLKFHRDADDTKVWIDEKDIALSSQDYGYDLASVQALKRKHEGIERDLSALEEKVNSLKPQGEQLMENHPDSAAAISQKSNELIQAWGELKEKEKERKAKLDDSFVFQKFLCDYRDQLSWIEGIKALVSSDELGTDVAGAEALLDRHQEQKVEIVSRETQFKTFNDFGNGLVIAEHSKSPEIREKLLEVQVARGNLEIAWDKRKKVLDNNMEEMVFSRDAEMAESWMQSREAVLNNEDEDSTDNLMKKQKDLERAIPVQEAKIHTLQESADKLIDGEHYNSEKIRDRMQTVMERWTALKEAVSERRSKLGESQSLQSVSRDVDDIEAWISEKLLTAMDESYKDPSNIQGKVQKHQALEAEVASNKDRVLGTISVGRGLIEQNKCHGTEDALKERLDGIDENWTKLIECCHIKTQKLKEASDQKTFFSGVQDVDFWLGEVENALASTDYGKDLSSARSLLKKHELTEVEIKSTGDRIATLKSQNEHFNEIKHFDIIRISETTEKIIERFEAVKVLAGTRRDRLEASLSLHQFLRDLEEQLSWIREKRVLASSQEFGKELTGVKHLLKKLRRLVVEVKAYEPRILAVLEVGQTFIEIDPDNSNDISTKCDELKGSWAELNDLVAERQKKLEESEEYQYLITNIQEENSWISEKMVLVSSEDYGDTLAAVQGLLKKHEAFRTDVKVHKQRVEDIQKSADALQEKKNFRSADIIVEVDELQNKFSDLENQADVRFNRLTDNSAFLQFKWKTDVVEAWIGDKESYVKAESASKDLSNAQNLLTRQDAFDGGLLAFENEGIGKVTSLKDELVMANHEQSEAIIARHDDLMARWKQLLKDSKESRERLTEQVKHYKMVEDLCLLFAKKASEFNSWFENADEDLTDPVRCNSVDQIKVLMDAHSEFRSTLDQAKAAFEELVELDTQIKSFNIDSNPYTWFDMDSLEKTWQTLQESLKERENNLEKEARRQDYNDELRVTFAEKANSFHKFSAETRAAMVELSVGTLEEQLEDMKSHSQSIEAKREDLAEIEDFGAQMEEALILDNKYTEHSTVGLAQQWDQLDQLNMRMQKNLEHQIKAKELTGVSDENLKEFTIMFKHFDKDKTGFLDHHEFKSCLRSLGYDLPVVEEGEEDLEFEAILSTVDPNGDGVVSLNEYTAFMISRETENVRSAKEVEDAFRAITENGKQPYVTEEDLKQALTKEQAEYCMTSMKPYINKKGQELPGYYDYESFVAELFVA